MLERLEVYNFKSYKGHQVIGPFKPFSCCIGPNGAGKSNVMDAISFVLGVRSSQLRSNQLRDLIYRAGVRDGNGNEEDEGDDADDNNNQPSQEEARDAWVLAVYVDKKRKEWRYRRSISINGASEYRLNDKVVTAAHYNKTLEEHSILVKAKNFLVFQGDVEAVASQSPKDLTKLIEQISGSLDLKDDYDKAKAVQDKATETSTHNFVKRRGINAEVKQFKEQKSEAEKFEQLRSDRDGAVIHHLLWKLYHIQNQIESATETIEERNGSLGEMRAEQAKHDDSLKTARKEVASAQKAVQKQEKEVKKREKEVEDSKPKLLEIQERMVHAKKKVKKARETLTTVEKEQGEQQGKTKSLENELTKIQKASEIQREEQRKASAAKGITLDEEDLKEYNRLKFESTRKAVKERQELESLERDLRTKKTELANLQDKLTQAKNLQDKLQNEEGTYGERKTRMEEKTGTIKQDLARVKKELTALQAERLKHNQQQTELQEKLEECHRKLQQADADKKETSRDVKLKEMLKDLQRVFTPNAVRGRVADLCKPTSRKYDTAVSIVLGRNLDAIVVDTHETGMKCMEYIRNNRAGVCTFLPLDTLTPKPVDDKFRNYARGARLAIDVIEFDPVHERAMLHSCGNALICDTMEIARHVSYEKGQEVKAVTLDGSMIHKSGLMTGGQDGRGQGQGKKWDDQEVANLNKQKENYYNQLKELMTKRPKENSDDRLVAEINRLETDLTSAKDDLSVTKNKVQDVKEQLKHASKQVQDYSGRVDKLSKTINESSQRLNSLKDVVSAAEDQVFSAYCKRIGVSNIREYESKQLKDIQAQGEANLKLDTTIARLKNTQAFETEQLKSINERLDTLQKAIASEERKLTDLEEQNSTTQAEITKLSSGIAEVQDALSELQAVLETKTAALEKVKKAAGKSNKNYDKAIKEIASLNDTLEKLASERFGIYRKSKLEEIDLPLKKGKLEKVPLEEGNMRDAMAMDLDESEEGREGDETQTAMKVNDYGIEMDFDALDEGEMENADETMEKELLDKIVDLQNSIDQMSPNMKAIDRLDEVEAKLASTSAEFDLARRAAKEAKDAFNALKKERCDLFNDAYNHISERIDQVYKDLTKGKAAPMGGVAYLSLEDSEEPYLSGIKYHAMPPMKRFRDMDQLSGGEKTMAALALLFAIHSYRPSPFFVLDEVDAALDNTNVGKIAEYVRSRASTNFQFIVISLKNSFWERASGLVGIMRDVEAGSSKVLTLDLEKYADV